VSYKTHKLGHIPAFYPQNKLNALRHFSEVMQNGATDYQNNGYKTSQEHREILQKVTLSSSTAIPGNRKVS